MERKKKISRSNIVERDGLKQRRLFEMRKVEFQRDQVEEISPRSNPAGAISSGQVSCNGHQGTFEKANSLSRN